jgi:hypothetical protein
MTFKSPDILAADHPGYKSRSYRILRYSAELGIKLLAISGGYCVLLKIVLRVEIQDALPLLTVGIIGATAGCLYLIRERERRNRLLKCPREE